MTSDARQDGLRERGKAKRRDAIVRAALKEFADRGFDATTIADIAAEAEVSPRTVTLYFPSKLDLALAHFDGFTSELAAGLRERPEGWTILDALEHWLRTRFTETTELDELSDRILEADPRLKGLANSRLAEVIQEGTRLFAEETGSSPDDFAPRLAAAAAAGIVSELCHSPEPENVEAAIAFIRAGVATLP
ncbi:TetR/AcrR family transcriptional regulator [Kitasatospora sp. NPDC096147]|uniref:TetR/AcrR family transcriptional regulator n=1 Tax=Kitasatospora sp. NPDC096147 TaxID=3364093 RepID=UPI003806E3C3